VPTYIFGYEYSYSEKTNIVAQYYVSPSVFTHEDTDLPGLLKTKYQISLGLRHRVDASVWTFAITENMRNFDNTPDIGFRSAGPTAGVHALTLRRGNQSPIRLSRPRRRRPCPGRSTS